MIGTSDQVRYVAAIEHQYQMFLWFEKHIWCLMISGCTSTVVLSKAAQHEGTSHGAVICRNKQIRTKTNWHRNVNSWKCVAFKGLLCLKHNCV